MMINRRKALTQVLALLSLENGLFLAAISLTYGMPLIVEFGVLFDVLVAVMVSAFWSTASARRSTPWTSASCGGCESKRSYDSSWTPYCSSGCRPLAFSFEDGPSWRS